MATTSGRAPRAVSNTLADSRALREHLARLRREQHARILSAPR